MFFDKFLKNRLGAVQYAANNYLDEPLPTQDNAKTFYFKDSLWLAQTIDENELHLRVVSDAGTDVTKTFRKMWRYICEHDGMIVYKSQCWE